MIEFELSEESSDPLSIGLISLFALVFQIDEIFEVFAVHIFKKFLK